MICAESEVLERHLDFLTGKSLLLTGAVNDEFRSHLRRQGFNARAWSWYFDYANRENQQQQSAVDFSFLFCLRFQAQIWFNPLNLGKRLRTLLLQEITTI